MTECDTDTPKKIETIEELHNHLQTAIELEHATIPAYLSALYSIKDGSNPEAALAIRGVVVEEMLHLTLAANILNAVGGAPSINSKTFVPEYPTTLPHSSAQIVVHLAPFSETTVDAFMAIEHPPENEDAPPQADEYKTIGQFYEAILEGIKHLVEKYDEQTVFSGQLSRQVQPHHYYGAGGHIHVVECLQSAEYAIKEIIDQGEGAGNGRSVWEEAHHEDFAKPRKVAAHYYRFQEIKLGQYYKKGDKPYKEETTDEGVKRRVDGPTGAPLEVDYDAVWPVETDIHSYNFEEGTPVREAIDSFNRAYKEFLNVLHLSFNGQPDLIASSVPMMYDLKYKAQSLMKVPNPKGNGKNVGPAWEWVPD